MLSHRTTSCHNGVSNRVEPDEGVYCVSCVDDRPCVRVEAARPDATLRALGCELAARGFITKTGKPFAANLVRRLLNQKEIKLMDRLSELADLDARLGELRRELGATDPNDRGKVDKIQEETSVLQKRKNEFRGITE